MKHIQNAVRTYLEQVTGVPTAADRTRVPGVYPMLAVCVRENGTVLLAGGALAEHRYQVTVTALSDREREENTALLAALPVHLLRGVPMESGEGTRVLHPLQITTEGEELTFSVELCVPVPPLAAGQAGEASPMETLSLEFPSHS